MSLQQHHRHPLYDRLVEIVGKSNVICEDNELLSYSQDLSPFPPVRPAIVVRPGSTQEISEIMKASNNAGNPVITRGGGASFTGFFDPLPDRSVVLETRRMNHIIDVDEENMTVTAECGALMSELEESVAKKGLYVHTVTVPVRYATLGGVLSGVAGGGLPVQGAVAGTNQNQLLGLQVVLPTGQILRTNAGGSNSNSNRDFIRGGNGPDLTGMFVGDAGSLGIKVEATLKVYPASAKVATVCWIFKEFDLVWSAMGALTKLETLPYTQLKAREMEGYLLMYEVEAENQPELERKVAIIDKICKDRSGKDAPESLKLFTSKLNNYMREAERVKAPQGMVAYVSGKSKFPEIHGEMKRFLESRFEQKRLKEIGVSIVTTFRPNERTGVYENIGLHYDTNHPQGRKEVLELYQECYKKLVALGVYPEPHQGFSSLILGNAWSEEYRWLVQSLKRAVDPNNILNPGLWNLG